MKKITGVLLLTVLIGVSPAIAQEQNTTTQEVKKTGKKIGNKTAEVASKGAAKVVDKTYEDKVGPGGETIYIDKHSKYYYVNSKGKHIYVAEKDLKNK